MLAVLSLGLANAQLVTDRPDQTESSSTIGYGNLQVESGLLVTYEDNDQNLTRHLLIPTTLFRYGVTKWIEVRVLNQLESQKMNAELIQGISDLEIGTKFQIHKGENNKMEVAFLSHLLVPTGTQGLSNDRFGTINKICVSHALTDFMAFGYNLGYNYLGHDNGDLTYSFALGVSVNQKTGIYIEPFGEISNFENFLLSFDSGFTYLVNRSIQIDFSFGTGVNHGMNYISIGCSWLMKQRG